MNYFKVDPLNSYIDLNNTIKNVIEIGYIYDPDDENTKLTFEIIEKLLEYDDNNGDPKPVNKNTSLFNFKVVE